MIGRRYLDLLRQSLLFQDRQRAESKNEVVAMNNYCEKEQAVRGFFLRRTNEGTVWECESCHFMISDMSKYKSNYKGLPVQEIRARQPKIL